MTQATEQVLPAIRDEEAVVRQWQASRSDEDFARVLRLHGGLCGLVIRRYRQAIRSYRLDFAEADAVAADGLFLAADRYRGLGAFSTYAVCCIRGAVTDWFRRHKRYRHASLEAMADRLQDGGNRADDLLADDSAERPDDQAGRRDLSEALQALIDQQCTAKEAEIIRLYFVAGWTLRAVGERVGLSCERIRQILSDCCGRLAQAIKDPSTLQLAEPPPDPLTMDWPPAIARMIRETLERDGKLPPRFRKWLQWKAEQRVQAGASN